jgi:hypothetical protein
VPTCAAAGSRLSDTLHLIPVGDAPTIDEVRAAIRSLGPVEISEGPGEPWYATVFFGPVEGRRYADGFEVTADADSVSVRGGSAERVEALVRALAAAAGPLTALWASEGEPRLITPS